MKVKSSKETMINPYGTFKKKVEDTEVASCLCKGECTRWFHLKCAKLSKDEYQRLSMHVGRPMDV